MPKRKAPEAAAASTPRNKIKKEASTAARTRHDRRIDSYGAASAGAPVPDDSDSGDQDRKVHSNRYMTIFESAAAAANTESREKIENKALASTKKWNEKRRKSDAINAKETVADVTQPLATGEIAATASTLEISLESNGMSEGEKSFLQSLGEEKKSVSSIEQGNAHSASTHKASTTIALHAMPSAIRSAEPEDIKNNTLSTQSAAQPASKIGYVEAMIVLIFFALNVFSAFFIHEQELLHQKNREQHLLEVQKVTIELSKSYDVERVIRSGIDILEQSQSKRGALDDFGENLFPSNMGLGGENKLQPEEEKNGWLERIRLLTMKKNLAQKDLDAKLILFGIDGIEK